MNVNFLFVSIGCLFSLFIYQMDANIFICQMDVNFYHLHVS